mmetsp:Transcript_13208/g.25151  ORF Transcript_13208/g.25151 Transcript_13208/m.25151 type:complete len:84 (-) Transcript_13208:7-258(-)
MNCERNTIEASPFLKTKVIRAAVGITWIQTCSFNSTSDREAEEDIVAGSECILDSDVILERSLNHCFQMNITKYYFRLCIFRT